MFLRILGQLKQNSIQKRLNIVGTPTKDKLSEHGIHKVHVI